MRLRSHDQGFVLAPPPAVYRRVADPLSYPSWWPGVRTTPVAGGLRLELGGEAWTAGPEGQRDDVGLFLALSGPPEGRLEWYLEPFEEGTVVSALLDLELPGGLRRSGRRLRRIRAALRRGLVGLDRAVR
jgi:hypothetical protein